jgi:hypothetical protein
LETSLSQGAEWNTAISKYIAAIPVNGREPCGEEQIISAPSVTAVMSAMIANVGAAARDSQ